MQSISYSASCSSQEDSLEKIKLKEKEKKKSSRNPLPVLAGATSLSYCTSPLAVASKPDSKHTFNWAAHMEMKFVITRERVMP